MTHILSDEFFRALSIAMFSLLVPIGVYVGRMNVRASRREIVLDLERLFQFAKSDGRPIILPSFELVKYKYDPDSNPERTGATISANSIRYYVFPVAIYVLLTFLCFRFAFTPRANNLNLNYYANPQGWQGMVTYTFLAAISGRCNIWSGEYQILTCLRFRSLRPSCTSCWLCSSAPP